MKIDVCVKQVPASNETRLDPVTHTILRNGAGSILNPFDTYAVEEALRIKESCGGTITAFSMGIPAAKEMLRRVLIARIPPPGRDRVEGIAAVARIDQGAAAPHPFREHGMDIRGDRFHVLIAEDRKPDILQVARKPPDIVQLHRADREPVFEQRHGQAEELRERCAGHKAVHHRRVRLNGLIQRRRLFLPRRFLRLGSLV